MNLRWLMGACLVALVGCQIHDRDAALEQSKGIAKSLWVSAVKAAQSVSSETSARAIQDAQKQMLALQAELSRIKMPDAVDRLRLAHVDEELEKLDYGLEMKDLQRQIDQKIALAKDSVEYSKKSVAQLRANLQKADAQFRALTEDYAAAKENFDAAASRVADIRQKLTKAGALVP